VLTLVETLLGIPLGMNFAWLAVRGAELPGLMSIAACVTLLLLALVTPLARDPRIFGAPANALAALVVGTVAFFALLGLSLRVLRFDIAAPLLGFSAPAALATYARGGRARHRAAERVAARHAVEQAHRRGGDALAAARRRRRADRGRWMRLYAEREGLFGEAFGMALFTLVMIAWFSSLIVWVARTLDQAAAQRAQAEGAATEQREWLQVTLASIGDGVIATDARGACAPHAAAQRLTGWRAAEAAGRPLDELLQLFDERGGAPLRNPLNGALANRSAARGIRRAGAARARRHGASGDGERRADPGRRRAPRRGARAPRSGGAAPVERAMREAYTEPRSARGAPDRGARARERRAA